MTEPYEQVIRERIKVLPQRTLSSFLTGYFLSQAKEGEESLLMVLDTLEYMETLSAAWDAKDKENDE